MPPLLPPQNGVGDQMYVCEERKSVRKGIGVLGDDGHILRQAAVGSFSQPLAAVVPARSPPCCPCFSLLRVGGKRSGSTGLRCLFTAIKTKEAGMLGRIEITR